MQTISPMVGTKSPRIGLKWRDTMESTSEFQRLYAQMFRAQERGKRAEAEALKCRIEEMRLAHTRRPAILPDLRGLPEFVRRKLGFADQGNCINAAFNFHFTPEREEPFSTMEFMLGIQRWFHQIGENEDWRCGDLLVFWSRRAGGSWDQRRIEVQQMKADDLDFPYGLVFDHVAVRLDREVGFHKPDPTAFSRYRVDYLQAIAMPTRGNRGFEVTYHRRKNYLCAKL